MISLIPSWAHNYNEFWDAIRRRNLWFIQMRYWAFLMLMGILLFSYLVLKIEYSSIQLIACLIISTSIFIYNGILHYVRRYLKCEPGAFNPLHFSLLQMVLDLIALLLLVYFTGGIESPLYMLFVFHMIIGSLILPGFAVYSMAFISYILLCGLIILEYFGIIPHHHLAGLLGVELSGNLYFVVSYMLTFGFTILLSVYLANGIAKQLYKRERDLYDSLIKINAAEKEKQKYIMGIVHELKTPLAAISSYLDLVLQKFLGPISKEVEEKIARAKFRSDEGIGMINDVLNVSKLKLYDEFDEEDVNLAGLVAAIIRNRKDTAEAQLISLTFNDERTKKEKIRGDKFLLNLAISNLIGNSIKYGVDEGKIVVTLKNKNGNQVVEVCDDGIGIPKEDLTKIFNDFYRSSNAKKIITDGSGLGLSVVKQVIERHGGTIKAESPSKIGSMSNPGTCFIIQLPVK
jgi:signal transduction histidine kinase